MITLSLSALKSPARAAGTAAGSAPPRPGDSAAGSAIEAHEPVDSLVSGRYYAEAQDRSEQQKYYGQLPPRLDRLSGGEFYRKLNRLLTRTHTRELAYNPGQYLYDWVDLRPNLRLRSIYSDVPVAREQPARSLEQQAQEWVKALAQGPTDAIGLARRIAQAETESYFNCEHAVPRIYFEDRQPMRGDLHHLFTSEQTINSARSSRKFVDFPDFEGRQDPALQGHAPEAEDGFEPAGGKGAVARATLYFLVRYPGELRGRYTEQDLQTLLRWHRDDPPSLHELHRNAEIFRRQGNRNPFIDNPPWAERVDFKLGLL